MLEIAEIFRLHGESFRAHHALTPWQLKAMADIEHCRTAYLGGHWERCDRCGHEHYSDHSCRNRHCPKCHGEQTAAWLEKQQARLLPVAYYLLTFTWPASLRSLAQSHPRPIYHLLIRAAVASLQKLARDPQWVGGTLPILAVLHTWTRALLFHPHVHLLVPAGGIGPEGTWVPAHHPHFLVPGYAVSEIFRAKIKTGLNKLGWLDPSRPCWHQKWVVHGRPAGSGEKVLGYLARYVFRIALSNSRLEQLTEGEVTFRYRDNHTQQLRHLTLPAEQWIERFLQHVLPKGFVKVRTYGLWSAPQRALLAHIQTQFASAGPARLPAPVEPDRIAPAGPTVCPQCKLGHMIFIRAIAPERKR
ncbi:MAG TPA: transposase, partial [Candidatus Acidoferrum sp.]|nr:transposase [Candidatus Acidoferrum sp.]